MVFQHTVPDMEPVHPVVTYIIGRMEKALYQITSHKWTICVGAGLNDFSVLEPYKGNSQWWSPSTTKNERGRVRNKSALSHTVNPEVLPALVTVRTPLSDTSTRPDK